MRRPPWRSLLVIAIIVLAGCTTAATQDSTTTSAPATPSATPTPAAIGTPSETVADQANPNCPRPLPEPPRTVTNDSARAFAEEYEQNRTFNEICSYDSFGLDATVARKIVTVERRTARGVYVFVQQPYYFTTGDSTGDGLSSGVYFVGNGSFNRLQYYGIEPQAPAVDIGSVREDERESVTVRMFNFASQRQTVSITLTRTRQPDQAPVWNESVTLTGEDADLYQGEFQRGNYTLKVSDTDGTTRQTTIRIGDAMAGEVAIYIGPTGALHVFRVKDDPP